MNPPFKITNKILSLVSKISNLQGNIESSGLIIPEPQLRKKNQIKTIEGTLSIEGNTLSEDQITALLSGKKILGNQKILDHKMRTQPIWRWEARDLGPDYVCMYVCMYVSNETPQNQDSICVLPCFCSFVFPQTGSDPTANTHIVV